MTRSDTSLSLRRPPAAALSSAWPFKLGFYSSVEGIFAAISPRVDKVPERRSMLVRRILRENRGSAIRVRQPCILIVMPNASITFNPPDQNSSTSVGKRCGPRWLYSVLHADPNFPLQMIHGAVRARQSCILKVMPAAAATFMCSYHLQARRFYAVDELALISAAFRGRERSRIDKSNPSFKRPRQCV